MENHRGTLAIIDLDHLAHNYSYLTQISSNKFICPIVKADAYGHGSVEVTKKLEKLGAQRVGVGLLEEAIELRESGVTSEILVFGVVDGASLEELIKYKITPVLSKWSQIQSLEKFITSPYGVHIKFDTGMHRLGFDINDANKMLDYFKKTKLLKLNGVCTHIHSADDFGLDQGHTFKQLEKFNSIYNLFKDFNCSFHFMNSACALKNQSYPQSCIDALKGMRPGLALYGVSPIDEKFKELRPVMSLKTHIIKLVNVKKSETVSYSANWKAKNDSTIAVLPLGYADGVFRALSNQGEALLLGHRVPVVGNVCMDYLMLDVTEVVKNRPHDAVFSHEVILLGRDDNGNEINANDIAQKVGTIGYEILTRISARVPRLYKGR